MHNNGFFTHNGFKDIKQCVLIRKTQRLSKCVVSGRDYVSLQSLYVSVFFFLSLFFTYINDYVILRIQERGNDR